MQSSKTNILVFHDRQDWPPSYVKYLNKIGFSAKLFRKPSECLDRVQLGLGNVDVILVHKDLGQNVPEEWDLGISSDLVVDAIHEVAPFVRVGVVSGEYPDGTKHVLKMGADFYVNALDASSPWVIEQYRRGVVTKEEGELRGRRVVMGETNSRGER